MSLITGIGWALAGIVLIIALFALAGIRVVYQYERGVIFVLGRLAGAKGPGVFWVPPLVSRMRLVDLRVTTVELPPQESVTRDNVTVAISAVLFFYVVNPSDAVNNVFDYAQATTQIAQTTLRSVIGQSLLDQILSSREEIARNIQSAIDQHTEHWGLKVTSVEIKDVQLPATMQRAMARQAEAERERRAKVLLAQGEFLAAQTLADAAAVLATKGPALSLRYLQTLTSIAVERDSTIVFPLPMDLIGPLSAALRPKTNGRPAPTPASPAAGPTNSAPARRAAKRALPPDAPADHS
jgi:regulator of protease activity HflC (stomatin/prohibitin superfamily)